MDKKLHNQNPIKSPAAAGDFSGWGNGGEIWAALIKIAKTPEVWLALLILAAPGYGYAMAVPAVDMDDLAIETYQQGGEFLRQGRFTVWLLQAATGIMRYQRFWPELFFALSLVFAGVVLAAVFYAASGRQPTAAGVLLLAGGLLLWPYHAEIIMYSNQCGVGFGFLLCAVALALAARHIACGWKNGLPGAAGAAVLLCLALGLYESFAPVWLTMIFALCLLLALRAAPHTVKPGKYLQALLRALWPLAAALLLRSGISAALRMAMGVTGSDGTAGKTIFWLTRASVKEAILIPLREFLDNYLALFFAVPAITLLGLACIALVVWACLHRCGNGRALFAAGLIFSQFSLGILQGTGSQMARTTQCFAVFVPFAAWLIFGDMLPQKNAQLSVKSVVCTILAVGMLVLEGTSLAEGIAYNRDRWHYEEEILLQTAAALDELDPSGETPVAFTGEIELSEDLQQRLIIPASSPAYKVAWVVYTLFGGSMGDLYRYENPQTSVINWAQTAFGSHGQMYLLMQQIGRPYTAPTPAQQAAADATEAEPGISMQDGYILVRF